MKPKDLGYPHELWTQRLLAKYIRKNCIKEGHPELSKIGQGTISKILNESKIKPVPLQKILKSKQKFGFTSKNIKKQNISQTTSRFMQLFQITGL
jgi:hypothetical protein